MVIYKISNNINQKSYIGQTKDFTHRMIAHKSDAYNTKSHSYKLPLHSAIRKYGWENFTKEILEECPAGLSPEEESIWANEKEAQYIIQYNSLVQDNGYNISAGGGQSPKGTMTFEERVALSKIFTLEEVVDIQNLLQSGTPRNDILIKYSPKLTESFLDNINQGMNFNNPKLHYPLFDYTHSGYSREFTREEQQLIKQDIIEGMKYSEISEKWNISAGLLALINNGSIWIDKKCQYPLSIRNTSRLQNWQTWVQPLIDDLEHSTLNLKQLSEKYNKAYSTVKKINEGRSYRDDNKKYPLTKYRK